MLRSTASGIMQEPISMLDQPISHGPQVALGQDEPGRSDRSMDALQYVLAFVAIVVAALLASIR